MKFELFKEKTRFTAKLFKKHISPSKELLEFLTFLNNSTLLKSISPSEISIKITDKPFSDSFYNASQNKIQVVVNQNTDYASFLQTHLGADSHIVVLAHEASHSVHHAILDNPLYGNLPNWFKPYQSPQNRYNSAFVEPYADLLAGALLTQFNPDQAPHWIETMKQGRVQHRTASHSSHSCLEWIQNQPQISQQAFVALHPLLTAQAFHVMRAQIHQDFEAVGCELTFNDKPRALGECFRFHPKASRLTWAEALQELVSVDSTGGRPVVINEHLLEKSESIQKMFRDGGLERRGLRKAPLEAGDVFRGWAKSLDDVVQRVVERRIGAGVVRDFGGESPRGRRLV